MSTEDIDYAATSRVTGVDVAAWQYAQAEGGTGFGTYPFPAGDDVDEDKPPPLPLDEELFLDYLKRHLPHAIFDHIAASGATLLGKAFSVKGEHGGAEAFVAYYTPFIEDVLDRAYEMTLP